MKLPKELKKKQQQKQQIKTIKPRKKKTKQYVVKPKKKFTETFAPYAIIIAVVFVVIIIFIVTSLDNSAPTGDNSNPYQTDITFHTIEGDTIKLADHQGKVILLFFFDLPCTACGPESDIISNIDDDYSNSQVYIVLITVYPQDSDDGLNQFANIHNLDSPIVRDDLSQTYASFFNIAYTPTTIILDKDGGEVERFIGYDANHYNQIKYEIDAL